MQDFEIRAATITDLERLLPLVTAYRVFYAQEPDAAREREYIAEHLTRGSSKIFIAHAGGEVAAFMQLFKTYSTVHLAPAFILEDLFVKPEHRKRGIAAALLERARTYAEERGASGMFLETAMDNRAAQRVYEAGGWSREERFYKYNAPLA